MFELSDKWVPVLVNQPETGMGYQIVTVFLRDGRQVEGVTIVGGTVASVRGSPEVPFTEEDVVDIRVEPRRRRSPELSTRRCPRVASSRY